LHATWEASDLLVRVCSSLQDLSENDLGRDTSSSLAIADALRVNTGIRTLLLARMTYYHASLFYHVLIYTQTLQYTEKLTFCTTL